MEKIFLLTDYKDRFGSKHFDKPYRSGMDKKMLSKYFADFGYDTHFIRFGDVINSNFDFADKPTLYTSSEDIGYHYKSYIEDIVLFLFVNNAKILPHYYFLRANNNKVFMELLRKNLAFETEENLPVSVMGTLEDFLEKADSFLYPLVIKTAEGASGSGVFLAKSKKEAIKKIKKISRTRYLIEDLKDIGRAKKHSGYIRESLYRNKFIVQSFIPNLSNDWKVYLFGSKLYIFYRPIFRNRGFRASGGGYDNYFYGKDARVVDGLLDYALRIFNKLNVPHASLDVAYDGNKFYLFEYQTLYFGTAGIPYSNGYFTKQNEKWCFISEKLNIEYVYVSSIVEYLKQNNWINESTILKE
ncbi:MAG: hypothetical protein ACOC2U_02680 [bacterium]